MTTCASAIDVGAPNADLPQVLDRFRCVFNQLDKGNLHKLQEVYGEDIQFQDPFGQIKGLDQLTEYMAAAYGNVIRCQFRFDEPVEQNGWCALPWVMELQHKRIRGGSPLYVNGISHLEIRDGKVRYHRDYFDAGQLLYEHLPVVGRLVRWVKERAG
ncbi:nuclear transport factor 2 family protein [Marinobacter daepoensis]|uniref:Nuclear transport factor 2 family protein n=1 Tax=Marinobacter daepoensis TaxID=262077 RepID=A0ABS3BBL5_9GAMM|nr:nuclear transport factor 2 family protein [Marinobacter daepoensis]MBN7769004.1 nuclear transport factor 2 family protein [Marinobacter daepoensis]MBY6077694.1 nuclear transport factor 2 family protein [Marinobacter daepoensis]